MVLAELKGGNLSQTLSTNLGYWYELSFMVSGDYSTGPTFKDLLVTWEGLPVTNATITKSDSWSTATMDYRLISAVVRATSEAVTVTFTGRDNNGP